MVRKNHPKMTSKTASKRRSKLNLTVKLNCHFLANFWHFWNFEKWKFLINDSLPELFLIRIREFGMRPQAIWMFYNHSVLNLSFLRLIVKRTKTKKVDFRFRMKFIKLEILSREVEEVETWRTSWRHSLKTRDWRRRRQEKKSEVDIEKIIREK